MPPKSKPPDGWPFALIAPDQAEPWFTTQVTRWLLRQLPEEYSHMPVVRDEPLILVRLLQLQLAGALDALRGGYRAVPGDFPHLGPFEQAATRRGYAALGRSLAVRLRGVDLVAKELQRRTAYPRRPGSSTGSRTGSRTG